MHFKKARWVSGLVGAAGALILVGALTLVDASTGPTQGATPAAAAPIKVALRRITESQYRHTIADVFGPDIKINARFEPEKRVDRLLSIGSAQLSLTSSGFEQYFALATSISDQVLADKQRTVSVSCTPADPKQADERCARLFIESYGERLFRRPLTEVEIRARLLTASLGTKQSNDFYVGLKLALTSMLVAPEFLFRVETAEPDPMSPGQYRLDAYTKAARLSFLLWDSAPDQELLAAARSGAIHSQDELKQQITRLISSPRFENGARAFFTDMLQLDGFENLVKDPTIYPKFSQAVADSAKEQTLKTIIELLIHKKADYRDLFTSNETFLNRPLASVYRVPFASTGDWTPYTFSDLSERSGILTDVAFLSLFAHPGSSSPTRRGIKLNEIFNCLETPDPPADVDFSSVQASDKGTVRDRLLTHMANPGCAVCHVQNDPMGLALEHFDGLGQLRTTENGKRIDDTAELNGVKIEGARGLGRLLRSSPRIPDCLVRNVFSYAAGRKADLQDGDFLLEQKRAFASHRYRFPDLMFQITLSPHFFRVVLPSGAERVPSTTNGSPEPSKPSKGGVQ